MSALSQQTNVDVRDSDTRSFIEQLGKGLSPHTTEGWEKALAGLKQEAKLNPRLVLSLSGAVESLLVRDVPGLIRDICSRGFANRIPTPIHGVPAGNLVSRLAALSQELESMKLGNDEVQRVLAPQALWTEVFVEKLKIANRYVNAAMATPDALDIDDPVGYLKESEAAQAFMPEAADLGGHSQFIVETTRFCNQIKNRVDREYVSIGEIKDLATLADKLDRLFSGYLPIPDESKKALAEAVVTAAAKCRRDTIARECGAHYENELQAVEAKMTPWVSSVK